MPPKFKFTKDKIINKAFEIVKKDGISFLTARSLAESLGSSTKTIFGLFRNMEEVKLSVINSANDLYHSYLKEDMESGKFPLYKASGMAYIRFAKEEKELFKLLFMRDRTMEDIIENDAEIRPIIDIIKNNLKISEEEAYLFHLEMWIYVHGIATMIATSYLEWDMDFVSSAVSDAYNNFKHKFERVDSNDSHQN